MALEKNIVLDNGSEAKYHKITNLNISYNKMMYPPNITENSGSFSIGANVASYKNLEFRTDKEYNPITSRTFSFYVSSSDGDITREVMYNKLKELAEFSGSLNV